MTLSAPAKGMNAYPIKGRCEKCGREFIMISTDAIDHYVRQGTYIPYWAEPNTFPECGGKIVRVDDPSILESNG